MSTPIASWHDALALERVADDRLRGEVHPGWDVYGIPHGGYLLAMAAHAAQRIDGRPDLLTVTGHFVHKARFGAIEFTVRPAGGGRRLSSHLVEARQNERVILTALVAVGDRDAFAGPELDLRGGSGIDPATLTGRAGDGDQPFQTPEIARRLGVRLTRPSAAFAFGEKRETARIEARMQPHVDAPPDALLALIACDATPPAVWNVLGMAGWVPTIELTAQVRARPAPGPLDVVVETRTATGGFIEEDAEVYDAEGRLVLLSRQLALFRGAGSGSR